LVNILSAVLDQLEFLPPGKCLLPDISIGPEGLDCMGKFIAERLRFLAPFHNVMDDPRLGLYGKLRIYPKMPALFLECKFIYCKFKNIVF
jgi:hypothetical protein